MYQNKIINVTNCSSYDDNQSDLLDINYHVLSGNNRNPMLVKRINQYLNKGLHIMSNKNEFVQSALKAIFSLIYGWNSCPVLYTNIYRIPSEVEPCPLLPC